MSALKAEMAAQLPREMKAWQVTRNGEPSKVLRLRTDYPVPQQIKSHNILVKISYATLNPADIAMMNGIPNWIPFRRNPVIGLDFCGTVVSVGSGVKDLAPGVEVCGALNTISVTIGRGSLAEYLEIPADKVALKPAGLHARDAAGATGIAGQTAVIVLREANLRPGDRLLVNGASGGVGNIITQVAAARGIEVYGVCSGANAVMVKGLGATEVIDYKNVAPLTEHLTRVHGDGSKSFHAIVDCVGDDRLFRDSAGYLVPSGILISIVGAVGIIPILRSKYLPAALGGVPRRYKIMALWPDGSYAREAAKWIDSGDFKHFLTDSEYAMEDVLKGYEKLASKRAKGKVVIKVHSP